MLVDMISYVSRHVGDAADAQRDRWHEAKLRGFRRDPKRQKGFTLVELLVAMTIFSLFSTMLVVALTQFMRTSQVSMQRTQSATRIANSAEQVTRFAQQARGASVSGDGSTLYLLMDAYAVGSTHDECIKLNIAYDAGKTSNGVLMWSAAEVIPDGTGAVSSLSFGTQAALDNGFMQTSTPVFALNGSMLTFQPTNGRELYGKVVSTTATVNVSIRNFSDDSATRDILAMCATA